MENQNPKIEVRQVVHLHKFYKDIFLQRLESIVGSHPRWFEIRKLGLDAFGQTGFEGALWKFAPSSDHKVEPQR